MNKDNDIGKVVELFYAKDVKEANEKLVEGWVVLSCGCGMRQIHHVAVDENDTSYDFDIPFSVAMLGRIPKETVVEQSQPQPVEEEKPKVSKKSVKK